MGAALSVSSSSTTNKDIVSIITNVIVKRTSRCEGTTVLDTAQDMDLIQHVQGAGEMKTRENYITSS